MAKRWLAGCWLFLCLLLAHAQVSAEQLVIGEVGDQHVVAEMPQGWALESVQPSSPGVITARLTHGSRPDGLILVSVLQPPADSPFNLAAEKTVHEVTSILADQAGAQAVEDTLVINRFKSGRLQGAYFSATDKAPPPGDFRYLSRGTATVNGLVASFTALSHVDASSAKEAVLQLVKSLRIDPSMPPQSTP